MEPGLVLEHFDQLPALELAEWAAFLNLHTISHLGFALFVVSVEFGGFLDDLAEFWVRYATDHGNNDGFIHAGGRDNANALFAATTLFGSGGSICCIAHNEIVLVWRLLGGGSGLLARKNRFDFGNGATEVFDPCGVFQNATLLLNAEIHDLMLHVGAAEQKFSCALVAEFLDFHNDRKG